MGRKNKKQILALQKRTQPGAHFQASVKDVGVDVDVVDVDVEILVHGETFDEEEEFSGDLDSCLEVMRAMALCWSEKSTEQIGRVCVVLIFIGFKRKTNNDCLSHHTTKPTHKQPEALHWGFTLLAVPQAQGRGSESRNYERIPWDRLLLSSCSHVRAHLVQASLARANVPR